MVILKLKDCIKSGDGIAIAVEVEKMVKIWC